MSTLQHPISSVNLIFPARVTEESPAPPRDASTPTVEPPVQPDVQPRPDIKPGPDEPVPLPTFVPRKDPGVEPAPMCPEGSPDEGDDDFDTCTLPRSASF